VEADDFSRTIKELEGSGYRLLMIKPADSPSEALLRSNGETIKIVTERNLEHLDLCMDDAADNGWIVGRAGMMYRDFVPDRLGGKLFASQIRIVDGGPVNDRVHYHKIDFQVIYCLKGAIKVVYEDQGEPFWLRPGDCVLQPPEIRHRVLEAEAGSEVIEITSPAEHETWFDLDVELPTEVPEINREFSGQRFARHRSRDAEFRLKEDEELLVSKTTIPHVSTIRSTDAPLNVVRATSDPFLTCSILIDGQGIQVDFSL
jgi:mannose-6-phosphate isomerase-like protein (cupin superfamily)